MTSRSFYAGLVPALLLLSAVLFAQSVFAEIDDPSDVMVISHGLPWLTGEGSMEQLPHHHRRLEEGDEPYSHLSFSQGTMKGVVVRLKFADRTEEPIPIDGNLKEVMDDTTLYYEDMSYGKLNLEWTYAEPQMTIQVSSSTGKSDDIKKAALEVATQNGYKYCEGKCGTSQASVDGDYDIFVMIFRPSNPDFSWAGLAGVGWAVTWAKYKTSQGVMEHEIGHNYGLPHQKTTKFLRHPDNTASNEGYTRMGGGGSVKSAQPETRFVKNGHLGICAKHWHRWIDEKDVALIHPDGASESCPSCTTGGNFTLVAFDRPDMVPDDLTNQNQGRVFAVRIPFKDTEKNEYDMFVYYRSSYDKANDGVSVAYCKKDRNGLAAGVYLNQLTYDVRGDTATMDDSTIHPQNTYVAGPIGESMLNTPHEALKILPIIKVNSISDWRSTCRNQTCTNGVLVTADVDVSFYDPTTPIPRQPDFTVTTVEKISKSTVETNSSKALIKIADKAVGPGGEGDTAIKMCGNVDVDVYVHDVYPVSPLQFGSHPGFGAVARHSFFTTDCCDSGSRLPIEGVRAVQVKQNLNEHLHIAEVEVIDTSGKNIASESVCYSVPLGNGYYNADRNTGEETKLTDGDYDTYSHSAAASTMNADLCVFKSARQVSEVRVYPRQSWWSRSNDLTVELYSHAGSPKDGESNPTLIGLLQSTRLETDWGTIDGPIKGRKVNVTKSEAKDIACPSSGAPTINPKFYDGEVFLLATPQSDEATLTEVDVNVECGATVCPINAFETNKVCYGCPSKQHVSPIGSTSEDQCTFCGYHWIRANDEEDRCIRKLCDQVVVSHPDGGKNPLDGIYNRAGVLNGHTYFKSGRTGYNVFYDGSGKWVFAEGTSDDDVAGAYAWATSDAAYPHMVDGDVWREKDRPSADDLDYPLVRAIKITQQKQEYLNQREIEIYTRDDEIVNIAADAECYSWPPVGRWFNGDDVTGREPKLNDGDESTFSHSGEGEVGVFDLCLLPVAKHVGRVVVHPRLNLGHRSNDLQVEMFSDWTWPANTTLESIEYGDRVVNYEHLDLSKAPDIIVQKHLPPSHQPLSVTCPYKTAQGCESEMNLWCQQAFGAPFVKARFDTTHRWWDDQNWHCYNVSTLTSDGLHYSEGDAKTGTGDLKTFLDSETCTKKHLQHLVLGQADVKATCSADGKTGACTVEMKEKTTNTHIGLSDLAWAMQFQAVVYFGESSKVLYPQAEYTSSGVYTLTFEADGAPSKWDLSGYLDMRPLGGETRTLFGSPIIPPNIEDTLDEDTDDADGGFIPDSGNHDPNNPNNPRGSATALNGNWMLSLSAIALVWTWLQRHA